MPAFQLVLMEPMQTSQFPMPLHQIRNASLVIQVAKPALALAASNAVPVTRLIHLMLIS